MQGGKAEGDAVGLQPPNGEVPLLRKTWYHQTWYCDDAEDERSRMRGVAMEMAMAKLLTFGCAGGPGSH